MVSLPKLKTHHWAGVTLSQKNLFGVMPGAVYGWPKNALHHAGLQQAILDIAAAVKPQLAIVDGIVGMEGDGPIMGQPRRSGVIVCGESLPAVDATCARLMAIPPVFRAIQAASGTEWSEMYQVFNMGHRMEVYCAKAHVKTVIRLAESFRIDAQPVGRTEKSRFADGRNHLTLSHGRRRLKY